MIHTKINFNILEDTFLEPFSQGVDEWSFNKLLGSSELLDLWEIVESGEVILPGGIALDHFGSGLQFIVHRGQFFQKVRKSEISSDWFVAEQVV
jgi:hypothetical protein